VRSTQGAVPAKDSWCLFSPPDPDEPARVARAVARLSLRHVVVTSVTRDDLGDGGSGHFAATIEAIRAACDATVEVLTPDFQGDALCVDRVLDAKPDVYNHNVETVPRLYPRVRPQARYERSLELLARVAARKGKVKVKVKGEEKPGGSRQKAVGSRQSEVGRPASLALSPSRSLSLVKSGLMVGLGESRDEVRRVMADLRKAGCEALTIGQYLRPSEAHLPVERFVTPEEFEAYVAEAKAMGFEAVAAGPFVRSSYHADALLEALLPE